MCLDNDKNVLFEKRTNKGIWQNLYQFPLIESKKSLAAEEFHLLDLKSVQLKSSVVDYSLYNDMDKVHKLSHQHLHTKFWILEMANLPDNAIPIKDITKYPTPVLISEFIEAFKF